MLLFSPGQARGRYGDNLYAKASFRRDTGRSSPRTGMGGCWPLQGCVLCVRRPVRALAFIVALAFAFIGAACSPAKTPERAVPGTITFHDTDLPITAAVALDDRRFVTQDGHFSMRIRPGNHPYQLMTLLGTYEGALSITEDGPIRLSVPAFPGWSRELYGQMGFGAGRNFTVRWPRDHTINVWIEEYTDASTRAAEVALIDWQGILNDAITFVRVESAQEAEMTVRFVPSFLLPGDGTVGTCTRWYTRSTGFMFRGEIQIARTWADRIGLHRHEIGHCIGLGHSPLAHHLMYPVLYNDTVTITERDMARLLYTLPPKSPQLASFPAQQRDGLHMSDPLSPVFYPSKDDLVIEIVR